MTVDFDVTVRMVDSGWEWWVERRPDRGIWGGLESFPATLTEGAGRDRDPESVWGPVDHILTHRRLTGWFHLHTGDAALDLARQHPGGSWVPLEDADRAWPRRVDKVLPELRTWAVKN